MWIIFKKQVIGTKITASSSKGSKSDHFVWTKLTHPGTWCTSDDDDDGDYDVDDSGGGDVYDENLQHLIRARLDPRNKVGRAERDLLHLVGIILVVIMAYTQNSYGGYNHS